MHGVHMLKTILTGVSGSGLRASECTATDSRPVVSQEVNASKSSSLGEGGEGSCPLAPMLGTALDRKSSSVMSIKASP